MRCSVHFAKLRKIPKQNFGTVNTISASHAVLLYYQNGNEAIHSVHAWSLRVTTLFYQGSNSMMRLLGTLNTPDFTLDFKETHSMQLSKNQSLDQ